VNPTKLSAARAAVVLKPGKAASIAPTFTPREVSDTYLKWTSSKSKVASVNSAGRIVAKTKGSAVVTATSVNGLKLRISVSVK
jgi:uncharacterized protein YjdB